VFLRVLVRLPVQNTLFLFKRMTNARSLSSTAWDS
jgi:hypothetical protein